MCPDCCIEHSSTPATEYGEFYYRCNLCGNVFIPDSYEELEGPNKSHCPHCESVDSIVHHEEESVCRICGLDPNYADYDASELAHLWKGRQEDNRAANRTIREIMVSSSRKFRKYTAIGSFLRENCGPHCAYAKACPQTIGNLAHCFNEERAPDASKVMPKRKKKRHLKSRNNQKPAASPRAWVLTAAGGWFSRDKRYGTNTNYTEPNTSAGSRS